MKNKTLIIIIYFCIVFLMTQTLVSAQDQLIDIKVNNESINLTQDNIFTLSPYQKITLALTIEKDVFIEKISIYAKQNIFTKTSKEIMNLYQYKAKELEKKEFQFPAIPDEYLTGNNIDYTLTIEYSRYHENYTQSKIHLLFKTENIQKEITKNKEKSQNITELYESQKKNTFKGINILLNKTENSTHSASPYKSYYLIQKQLDGFNKLILSNQDLKETNLSPIGIKSLDIEKNQIKSTLIRSKKEPNQKINFENISKESKSLAEELKKENYSQDINIDKELFLFKVKNKEDNKEMYITKVVLTLNEEDLLENVSIIEIIPKDIATSIKELSFSIEPDIIEEDPIVKWSFDHIPEAKSISLSYTIPKKIESVNSKTISSMNIKQNVDISKQFSSKPIIYTILGLSSLVFVYGKINENKKKKRKH